jgi:tetratricopeptide (TPR) repeat protein
MRINGRIWFAGVLVTAALAGSAELPAQKDSVHLKADSDGRKSLVRGKIVEMSPFKVVVEADGEREEVAVNRISKVNFGGEPRDLTRAREHLENQRFDDCLDSIEKIDDLPDSAFMRQEVQFLRAYADGKKALRGDPSSTIESAENGLASFIKANNDSYQLVKAVDLYGHLLMADGKTAQAGKEFNRLTRSGWDIYQTRGHFFEGETLIHQAQYDQARKSFEAVMNQTGTTEEIRQFQLLAKCQLAKIDALQGDVNSAIAALEKIIQNENSDNTQLFAYAYNALGTGYLQSEQLKKACRAFLHTELLFSTEPDAHAEALFQLSKIWMELKETDRANQARELLTNRYRNTIWAQKL